MAGIWSGHEHIKDRGPSGHEAFSVSERCTAYLGVVHTLLLNLKDLHSGKSRIASVQC